MAATKTKPKSKKRPVVVSETPITIGGGGGSKPKLLVPLTIQYDPTDWVFTPGLLKLPGGNVKKIIITTGDFELRLPVNGSITIDVRCSK